MRVTKYIDYDDNNRIVWSHTLITIQPIGDLADRKKLMENRKCAPIGRNSLKNRLNAQTIIN